MYISKVFSCGLFAIAPFSITTCNALPQWVLLKLKVRCYFVYDGRASWELCC